MKTSVTVRIGTYTMLELADVLQEVVVDQNYFLPAMCTIVIREKRSAIPGAFDITDNILRLALGTSIEISFGSSTGMPPIIVPNTVFKGELTSIEPVFHDNHVTLRLRGYDKGHRLTHGKATRTYGDGSPFSLGVGDGDIVQKIAMSAGLTAAVDALLLTTVKYKYVMQYNQNDWDFLWARANRVGYQVYVDGSVLHFAPAGKPRSLGLGPSKLTFGENLVRFEPRLTAANQMTAAEAHGWSSSLKQGITSKAVLNTSANTTMAVATAVPPNVTMKTMFGSSAESAVIDPTMDSVAWATIAAGAEYSRAASSFMKAYGELDEGDPYLVAGSTVVITGVGARFSGSYYITEAKHIYRNGTYRTTFGVTGGIPNTFRSLLLGPDHDHELNRVDGVMTAVVTSNNDPESLGRVQVKYPWLPKSNGAELSSGWARVVTPGGGSGRGVVFIPEVNDEVLVAFENGDMSAPYVVGVLYNSRDKLPSTEGALVDPATKKVNKRVIISRAGHKIVLDDSQGQEKITISDKTGKNLLTIDSVKNEFTINSEGPLNLTSKGDMTLNATGKLVLKSKGNVELQTEAAAQMKANSTVSISGNQNAEIKAGQSSVALKPDGTEVKGVKVDVKANTSLGLNGTAMVQVQGGIVKIN